MADFGRVILATAAFRNGSDIDIGAEIRPRAVLAPRKNADGTDGSTECQKWLRPQRGSDAFIHQHLQDATCANATPPRVLEPHVVQRHRHAAKLRSATSSPPRTRAPTPTSGGGPFLLDRRENRHEPGKTAKIISY